MKFYLLMTKKGLAVILALFVIVAVCFSQYFSAKNLQIDGSTHEKRVNYIKSLGLEPDENGVTVKNITLPQNFSEVYKEYNNLQKKAGFDLSRYKSKPATVYSFPVGNDTVLHLIVCDGTVVGGDIAETRLDGEMKPLLKRK